MIIGTNIHEISKIDVHAKTVKPEGKDTYDVIDVTFINKNGEKFTVEVFGTNNVRVPIKLERGF